MYKPIVIKLFLFPFFILALFLNVSAQDVLNQSNGDSLTYELYEQGKWNELLDVGNNMLENGADYYFLRMRLGIAEMQLKNYTEAEKHFRKALVFNSSDQNANILLYRSLAATNRTTEAGSLYNQLAPPSRETIGLRQGYVPISVHFDAAATFRSHTDGLGFKDLTSSFNIYGQERLYQNNGFYDFGMYFKPAPQMLMYIGFQSLKIGAKDHFAYLESSLEIDSIVTVNTIENYYYRVDTAQKSTYFDHQLNQQSLYTQVQWSPSTQWNFIVGLHVLDVNRDFTISEEVKNTVTDTAYFDASNNEVGYFSTELTGVDFYETAWQTYDYSLSVYAKRHFGKITAQFGVNSSSINDSSILQLNAGFLVLPFGNLNFYNQTEVFYCNTEGNNSWAAKTRFGGRLTKTSWVEAEVFAGRLNNISDQYGYIIYNNPETLHLRFEGVLTKFISDHIQIQLRYRYSKADRKYEFSVDPENSDLQAQTYTIHAQTIIGGIKWIF